MESGKALVLGAEYADILLVDKVIYEVGGGFNEGEYCVTGLELDRREDVGYASDKSGLISHGRHLSIPEARIASS